MTVFNGLKPVVAGWQRGLYHVLTQQNGVEYRVNDKVRTAQLFVFRLALAQAADLAKTLKLAEEIGLVLGVESPRLARNLAFVDLEIPLPEQYRRALPVRALRFQGRTQVALGQTVTGQDVVVDLAGNRACHALISGTTGSGKTLTEHLIAWSLAMGNPPHQVNLLLVDGKGGTKWWGFDKEAHLAHPVIGSAQDAVAALTWCVAEVDRRKHDRRRAPRLFIIVDEVRELLTLGGEPVAEAIQRIAALGRELGVHIIVATQHALADALGGSIAKANLPLRLTGRVSDANAAFIATGVKGSGAEGLYGNGDFLLTAAGQTYRVQIALLGNREIGLLPRVEETPRLDFDLDLARVLDVTPRPPVHNAPDALDPRHVAVALASGKGITWLAGELKIGSNKAKRVREFAQEVQAGLRELNYTIIPAYQEGPKSAPGKRIEVRGIDGMVV